MHAELEEGGIPIDPENPDIVIIGYDTTLDYKKMTRVCDLVRGAALYRVPPRFQLPHRDRICAGYRAIIAFIEASARRRPDLIVGKPHGGIVEAAVARTKPPADQMAMVGDRLYTAVGNRPPRHVVDPGAVPGEKLPKWPRLLKPSPT